MNTKNMINKVVTLIIKDNKKDNNSFFLINKEYDINTNSHTYNFIKEINYIKARSYIDSGEVSDFTIDQTFNGVESYIYLAIDIYGNETFYEKSDKKIRIRIPAVYAK